MDNKTSSDLLEIERQLLKLSPNLSVFKEKYRPCDGQSPQWRRTETYGEQPSNPTHFDMLAAAAARIAQLPENAFRARLLDETLEYRARFIDGLLDYLLQQTSRSFRSDYLGVVNIPDGLYRVDLYGLPTIAVEYVRWLQLAQLHEAASSRLSAPTKSASQRVPSQKKTPESLGEAELKLYQQKGLAISRSQAAACLGCTKRTIRNRVKINKLAETQTKAIVVDDKFMREWRSKHKPIRG